MVFQLTRIDPLKVQNKMNILANAKKFLSENYVRKASSPEHLEHTFT